MKALRASVPDELSKIVERMMAKEPAARFATPTEVAAALTPFATGSDLAGLLATSLLPRGADAAPARLPLASSPPWWRRRSIRIAAATVPIVVLLAIFIYIKIEISKTKVIATTSIDNKPADDRAPRDASAPSPPAAPADEVPGDRSTSGQDNATGPSAVFARPEVASVAYGRFAYSPAGWRLVPYKGNVYFAPWDDGNPKPSKVFRYNPKDGLRNGENHTTLAETTGRFTTMKEMGGVLYIADSTGAVRSFDGLTVSSMTGTPFNDSDYVTAMAEFKEMQYYGTALGKIFKNDGSPWPRVFRNKWGAPISDLCSWKGSLYAGVYGTYQKKNGFALKWDGKDIASRQTVISDVQCGSELFLATPDRLYAAVTDDTEEHNSTVRRSADGVNFTTISGPGPFKFPFGNPMCYSGVAYIFENGSSGEDKHSGAYVITDDGKETTMTSMINWTYRVLSAAELDGDVYAIGTRDYTVVGNVYLLRCRSKGEVRRRAH